MEELKEKALRLLAARPYSRKELVDKLGDGGDEVVVWLEHLGYLNDAEYAKTVARHYAAKGYGQARIRAELLARGVSREYWPEAEEAPDLSGGIDAFLQRKLRGKIPDETDLRRLTAALARRGHKWGDIKEALNRYGAEIEDLQNP